MILLFYAMFVIMQTYLGKVARLSLKLSVKYLMIYNPLALGLSQLCFEHNI